MNFAAFYGRVSTPDQKDNGTSLGTQKEAGLAKASEMGFTLPAEYIILEDWSGTDLQRPGLLRLFELASSGLIEAVIVLSLDRLYRPEHEGEEWRIFEVLNRFETYGVEVISTDSSIPSQGPMAGLITYMNTWKSGEERRTTRLRTRTGRLAVARRGGLLGGYTALGYMYIPKTPTSLATLVINESQAGTIRQMYKWLLEDKLSCRAIARRLTEMGIPTPHGNKIWQPSVVNHMLRQELYCGISYFNRREPVRPQKSREQIRVGTNPKSSRRLRPEDEWIPIPVPAIIDRTTWEQAQVQLKANSKFSPRNNTRHIYLLRGLVRCGACGKAYSGVTNRGRGRDKEYQYYTCNQRNPTPGEVRCTSRNVPLTVLEGAVWNTITGLVENPATLESEYRSRLAKTDLDDSEQERKLLKSELSRLDKAADRFLDLYGDEHLDREQLDNKLYENSGQKKAINEQLQVLDQRKREEANRQRKWKDLQAFCDSVSVGLDNLNEDERQRLLRLLIERVTINGKSIRIELAVPLDAPQAVSRLRPMYPPPSPP